MNTKIVITVGPSVDSEDMLRRLVEQGVRIFRLNFSHGNRPYFETVISRLQRLEQDLGVSLSLLQDLSGPKIRIGEVPGSPWEVLKDDRFILGLPGAEPVNPPQQADGARPRFIELDQPRLLETLEAGDTVTVSDGNVQFRVLDKINARTALLKALNASILTSRKGVAFPGKVSPLPALTEKDKQDLAYGLELGVNAVALSFVQDADDVRSLLAEMDKHGQRAPIIAKLERQNAVENLEEILELSDGIMVARGDLGLECPLPVLPGLQKKIIRACNRAGKPVIVATQMLLSMVDNRMPTRAETTDVANAVHDGADCVMLSEETAIGRHPLEAVQSMGEIALEAELFASREGSGPMAPQNQTDPAWFLAYAACLLADKAQSAAFKTALAAHTMSGATARLLSACRPEQQIHALSPDPLARRFLNFSRGVRPHPVNESIPDHLQRVERFVDQDEHIPAGSRIVITAGQPKPGQERVETNVVKIYQK